MARIRIAPIVEGYGETIAVRTLLERIWIDVVGGEFADVLRPIRKPRSKFLRKSDQSGPSVPDSDEICRAVQLGAMKLDLEADPETPSLVLLMLDADDDCPKAMVESLQATFAANDPRIDVAVVFPCVEYETWFVAAAGSLREFLDLQEGDCEITNPEERRFGKSWIEQRFRGRRYSETVDQVRLTASMDLRLCRERCPSFDKLCRELVRRTGACSGP